MYNINLRYSNSAFKIVTSNVTKHNKMVKRHIQEEFGFRIFRLREAKESDEFLLFDISTNRYNQYSKKRLAEMLISEIQFKNRSLYKYIFDDLGISSEKNTEFKVLLSWIQQETQLIDNLNYKPSDELIFSENSKLYFNVYKKAEILKHNKFEEGSFIYIKELIMNLVSNNQNEYDYFISWIGWQLQNPLKRLPTSIIFQGEHGTGKTKFCELVLQRIFGNNFCEIGQTDINKEYNEYILGKQLIVANEVIHNDNKFLVPDKLKNYVTDEYLSINRKFKDTIYVRNYSQWIFISNNQVPLKIEKGDRRYSVFKSKKLVNGFQLIENLKENIDEELEHFMNHLMNLEIDFTVVSTPLQNEAKEDIIKLNYNSVEEFIDYAIEKGGFDALNKFYSTEDFYNNLEVHIKNENCFIVTDKLYKLYLRFCQDFGINMKFARNGFSRQLKNLGFSTEVIRLDSGTHRAVKIIDVEAKQ